jgi:hypothetical protein
MPTAAHPKNARPATATITPIQPMMMIEAAERKSIPVDLVGVQYSLIPPKAAFSLRIAQRAQDADKDVTVLLGVLMTWMTAAFGDKQATKIMARLDDPDDLLDFGHLLTLLQKVVELGVNPTS